MGFEVGDGFYLVGFIEREAIDVEGSSVAFAEEIDCGSVGCEYGVAVFAWTVGEVGVLGGLDVVFPDVACDGRRVVLAPFVFKSFFVLIEEVFSVGGIGEHFGGCS